ncbi:MAG: hypothetical protein K8R88_05315 [Armatimonadetes bacterium]|nr:hypothetical protein [Armatimonadota bacterium]
MFTKLDGEIIKEARLVFYGSDEGVAFNIDFELGSFLWDRIHGFRYPGHEDFFRRVIGTTAYEAENGRSLSVAFLVKITEKLNVERVAAEVEDILFRTEMKVFGSIHDLDSLANELLKDSDFIMLQSSVAKTEAKRYWDFKAQGKLG